MLYSEASYFDGYHFSHIAAWEDAQRIARGRKHFVRNIRYPLKLDVTLLLFC